MGLLYPSATAAFGRPLSWKGEVAKKKEDQVVVLGWVLLPDERLATWALWTPRITSSPSTNWTTKPAVATWIGRAQNRRQSAGSLPEGRGGMTRPRGTVRQRASGRWYAILSVTDATGKPTRPTIGPYRTKAEANQALTAALAERDAGTYVVPSAEPWPRSLATWLDGRRHDLRPSTWHGYQGVLARYMDGLGSVPLLDLTARKVEALYAAMVDGGLSPRTVRTLHVVLRRALADAVRWQVLARSPMDAVRPPRLTPSTWRRGTPRNFAGSDVRRRRRRRGDVRRHPPRRRDGDATRGSLRTAMGRGGPRAGAAPRRDDECVRRRNRARRSAEDGEGSARHRPGPRDRGAAATLAAGAGPVALRRPDAPPKRSATASTPLVRDWRRTADAPRIRFHDLRHTAATLMLAGGIPVHVVAARLGHATPTITLSVYAHVLPTQGIEAAAMMGAVTQRSPNNAAVAGD